MATWGPTLRTEMAVAAASVGISMNLTEEVLRIGTDCSGLEAPILSLQALDVRHQHVFSSELQTKVRMYIEANFASASPRGNPGLQVYPDMMKRDLSALAPHDVYVCGFPCQPFSSLHNNSKGLREAKAQVFFKMLETLTAALPAVAVLENVNGVTKYLPKIWKRLKSLKWYEVLTCNIDPADMGEPVSRNRVFLLLIRVDVARCRGTALDELAAKLLAVGIRTERSSLVSRLLLCPSPMVQQQGRKRKASASAASRGPPPPKNSQTPKWVESHAGRRSVESARVGGPSAAEGATARQLSLYGILKAQQEGRPGNVIDVSQSLGRARFLHNVCPVITPGSRIWVSELHRFVSPMEKILLHLVPVHQLVWPEALTDTDVSCMGGNTMHLMAAWALVGSLAAPHRCCKIVAMRLPCICHVFAMRLPYICHAFAMYLPCICHAFAMYLPCICHVFAM
jgi:site-specific DNA-cytosine methylase